MMINFEKIRWKNFLSTGNVFTEINLATNGNTLVMGPNGSGKSTLLDTLTFALFGKPFRNINKPQLLNTINRKDLLVEIEFSVAKTKYKIVRGIKPNVFEVYCNNELINQSAETKDYQEYIERNILKINYKSFCQVVILGSASYLPFMQLPAAQRRAIIEDLLDLQIFTTMNILLKENIQANNENIQQINTEKRVINEKITMAKDHLKEIQSKSEQFISQKKTAIDDLNYKIVEISEIIEQMNQDLIDRENEIKSISKVENGIEKLKDVKAQLDVKLDILKKDIKFLNGHDDCPTCKQEISNEFKCQTVEKHQQEIQNIQNGLVKWQKKYDEYRTTLSDMKKIDRECQEIRTNMANEKLKIKMYKDQINSLTKEVDHAKNGLNNNTGIKISDLEQQLITLTDRFNELQEDKLVLNAASLLLKDDGIKTKIVNQYIPIINKLINKYLSEFDLFVEFNLDEQFNEVIKSRYRDEFSYTSFSEGEKTRIDLSILFTWRAIARMRNSLNTNLLILDEVFDSSLDGNAADDLFKILHNIGSDSSVFVISHRDNLHDKFANVIKFNKQKNFSRISE